MGDAPLGVVSDQPACASGQVIDIATQKCVAQSKTPLDYIAMPAIRLGIKGSGGIDPTPIVAGGAIWLGLGWLLFRGRK